MNDGAAPMPELMLNYGQFLATKSFINSSTWTIRNLPQLASQQPKRGGPLNQRCRLTATLFPSIGVGDKIRQDELND